MPAILSQKTENHGGARKGAGRKTADGATGVIRYNITLTRAQKTKLEQLGGSVWIRAQITAANDPQ